MAIRRAYFTGSETGEFVPTVLAQSQWGDDHLNGPSMVGLASLALQREYGSPEFHPARLTVDLFKAARGVVTTTSLRLVRDGRRVRNAECDVVQDGVVVTRATLVQYRRSAAPLGQEWTAPGDFAAPALPHGDSGLVLFGSDDAGWTRAPGDHQNTSRKRFYHRGIDVVEGEDTTPFVRAAMAAEGTSLVTNLGSDGVGYINGDLTVALSRLPIDAWIGVQADSHLAHEGIAVGTATLFDSAGAFGSGLITAISNPAAHIDFAQ